MMIRDVHDLENSMKHFAIGADRETHMIDWISKNIETGTLQEYHYTAALSELSFNYESWRYLVILGVYVGKGLSFKEASEFVKENFYISTDRD